MRAALALRTSSGKQRDACTVETQREAGLRLIAQKGWTLVETYADDGKSAKAGNLARRPDMNRLLDDAEAHRFDVVVFYDMSRATRAENQKERGLIVGTLQLAGVQIAYASTGEVIDATTDAGDFKTTLDSLFAAHDNRLRRQRALDGRHRAAREGRNPGKAPMGYRCNKGKWTAPGAELVREVYERAARRESCAAIAGDLNARGVPSSMKGRRWNTSTISDILKPRSGDPYVTGLWFGQKGEPAIAVPRIISAELAERARASLAARTKAPPASTRYVNFLDEHAARCALCGSWIRIAHSLGRPRADGSRVRYAYYTCDRRVKWKVSGTGEACTLPVRRVDATDAAVWRAVVALVEGGKVTEGAAEGEAAARDQLLQDLEEARRELASWEQRLEALAKALGAGLLTADAYLAQAEQIGRRRDHWKQQVATWEAASNAPAAPTAAERAEMRLAIRAATSAADPAERRALVRLYYPLWEFGPKGIRALRTGGRLGEQKPGPVRIAVAC